MEATTTNLIDALVAKQAALNLGNQEFAERLGISRPLWVMTKSGRMPVGIGLLSGVSAVFPDLADDVLQTLTALHDGKRTADDSAA